MCRKYAEITPQLLDEYQCDVACHGHDAVIFPNGIGMYDKAKEANRFIELRRSEGVSTTILIHRILHPELPKRSFPITSTRIQEFRLLKKQLVGTGVFIGGYFDLLHGVHSELLEQVRKFGDFLIVGLKSLTHDNVHEEDDVSSSKNKILVQSEGERILTLLSMKAVDDVIWEYEVTQEMCQIFNIKTIIRIQHPDYEVIPETLDSIKIIDLKIPDITTKDIIDRILEHRLSYEERNSRRTSEGTLPMI